MSRYRILSSFPSSANPLRDHPVVQESSWSPTTPWSDIVEVEKFLIRQGEVPEMVVPAHSVGLRLGPPGVVAMRIAGGRARRTIARTGDFCLFSEGTPLSGQHQLASAFLAVGLRPSFVATLAGRTSAHRHRVEFTNPCSVSDPAVGHIVQALAAEAEAGCPAGRLYGESLAMALAVHLLRHYAAQPLKIAGYRGGLAPARLRRVLDYIAAEPGARIGLRELAALAELSPHHFAGLFKQSTGLPPHQYVLQQRVATAKKLLADSRMSLAEISEALGFPSQAHFTTMFRKHAGTTPGAYRAGR